MSARDPIEYCSQPFTVPPEAVHIIPPDVTTKGALRDLVGFDDLVLENPDHELFIVVYKLVPDAPFAVVMRIRKDVVHIQGRGLPLEVDLDSRIVVVYPPGRVPLGDGRVG